MQPAIYLTILLTLLQESEQTEIELQEDKPDALEGVLHYIYGCETEEWDRRSWQYWLDLVETADKYLEPKLSERASRCFETLAFSLEEQDVGTICEILQTLQDVDRYERFSEFAVDLTMSHLDMLENEQFSAQVYSCKTIMFKMVQSLSWAVDLDPVRLDCATHGDVVYYRKPHGGR